jgi:hypothetical protein
MGPSVNAKFVMVDSGHDITVLKETFAEEYNIL